MKTVTRKLINLENDTDQLRYIKIPTFFPKRGGLKQGISFPTIPMRFILIP